MMLKIPTNNNQLSPFLFIDSIWPCWNDPLFQLPLSFYSTESSKPLVCCLQCEILQDIDSYNQKH